MKMFLKTLLALHHFHQSSNTSEPASTNEAETWTTFRNVFSFVTLDTRCPSLVNVLKGMGHWDQDIFVSMVMDCGELRLELSMETPLTLLQPSCTLWNNDSKEKKERKEVRTSNIKTGLSVLQKIQISTAPMFRHLKQKKTLTRTTSNLIHKNWTGKIYITRTHLSLIHISEPTRPP